MHVYVDSTFVFKSFFDMHTQVKKTTIGYDRCHIHKLWVPTWLYTCNFIGNQSCVLLHVSACTVDYYLLGGIDIKITSSYLLTWYSRVLGFGWSSTWWDVAVLNIGLGWCASDGYRLACKQYISLIGQHCQNGCTWYQGSWPAFPWPNQAFFINSVSRLLTLCGLPYSC